MMKIMEAFQLVFLLVVASHVATSLPSPTNLSVTCHNFRNILYWNYSEPSLHPLFTVEMFEYKSARTWSLNTTQQHLVISSETKTMSERYGVFVKAVLGAIESESIDTEFSYDVLATTFSPCSLDFPTVNMSVREEWIEVQFLHPYNVYKKHLKKTGKEDFHYTIHPAHDERTHLVEDTCSVRLCQAKFPIYRNLSGDCIKMHVKGTMSGIPLKTTKTLCSPKEPAKSYRKHLILSIACPLIILPALGLLGILVFRKLTQSTSLIPKFMRVFSQSARPNGATLDLQRETTCRVDSVEPGDTPLLLTPETMECLTVTSDSDGTPQEEGTHFPIRIQDGFGSFSEHGSVGAPGEGERDGVKESGYDCPHGPAIVEMSPGDQVEGYGAC